MSDFKDLKNILKNNIHDVMSIIDSTRFEISNSPSLKMLHSNFLYPFWEKRPNKKIEFAIYFDEEIIENFEFESIKDNIHNLTERLKTFNLINVDNEFNIHKSELIEFSAKFLIDYSKQQKIIFFFGEEGIEVAIRGEIIDKINMFYNESERMSFAKKYRISELDECLKDYQRLIHEPGVNQGFFASENKVREISLQIGRNPTPTNILHNKPEKMLRDNLLSFLNRNTQHTFSKENELNNQRELDLYAEVEGRKYLIEVKWLGQSINDTESGFNQKVTDVSAREGVTQTLEYIQELIEKMNYNVHCGFLCVFDARENKREIRYNNFDFISEDLKTYFENHFRKLNEIQLDKI